MDASFLASLTFLLCCACFSSSAFRTSGSVREKRCARAAIEETVQRLNHQALGIPSVVEISKGHLYRVEIFAAGQTHQSLVLTERQVEEHNSPCVATGVQTAGEVQQQTSI